MFVVAVQAGTVCAELEVARRQATAQRIVFIGHDSRTEIARLHGFAPLVCTASVRRVKRSASRRFGSFRRHRWSRRRTAGGVSTRNATPRRLAAHDVRERDSYLSYGMPHEFSWMG